MQTELGDMGHTANLGGLGNDEQTEAGRRTAALTPAGAETLQKKGGSSGRRTATRRKAADDSAAKKPATTTRRKATTEKPATTTRRKSTAEKPATTTRRKATTEKPATTTRRKSTAEKPAATTRRKATTEKPAATTRRKSTAEKPAATTRRKSTARKPATLDDALAQRGDETYTEADLEAGKKLALTILSKALASGGLSALISILMPGSRGSASNAQSLLPMLGEIYGDLNAEEQKQLRALIAWIKGEFRP